MTTPIDTTRLRANAEAVRDAGAVMRAAREHSDHALTASSADEYRKAAEAFRSAQKALYRDAPPDGLILALLDERDEAREQLATANEKLLDALRREKAALDKLDALQGMAVRALADKDAEITRLSRALAEECE